MPKISREKILHPVSDEIIFGSSDKALSKQISRLKSGGEVKEIAPRLYTSNLVDRPEVIVKRNWYKILAHKIKRTTT